MNAIRYFVGLVAVLVGGCASTQEEQQAAAWQEVAAVATPNDAAVLPVAAGLEDYLAYAALNNPELKSAFHQWKAMLARVPQARALSDPKFTYGYFIREVETRVGPQRQRFGVSQTFPWLSKLRLRRDAALEDAWAAHQRYEGLKLRLFYRVKEAYYELYYLNRALEITGENLELLKHLEGVAQARFKSGAPYAGVVKAQVELSRLTDRRRTLEETRAPVLARLNAALNRPSDTALTWPTSIELTPFEEVDLAGWLLTHNPELKALEHTAQRDDKAVALAKKEIIPDLALGLDYIQTDPARVHNVPDSGKDPVIAMLSVSVPLWWGKYRAQAAEAEARLEATLQTRNNRQNQLQADLQMALFRLRDAERKMNLFRDTLLPQARAMLAVTEQAYKAGNTDFLDLVDAQEVLLELQLEQERALATREASLAEIEMLVGRSLTGRPAQFPKPLVGRGSDEPPPTDNSQCFDVRRSSEPGATKEFSTSAYLPRRGDNRRVK